MQYGYCMVRVSVTVFNATFNNISIKSRIYTCIYMAVSLICVGNRTTHGKPVTCCKSLSNFII